MKTIIKIQSLIIALLLGFSINAQEVQKSDADDLPTDKNGYQYGYSNESAYIFDTNKDKNLQVLGKNYYDTPAIFKKDQAGEIIWKKVIIPSDDIWLYQLLLGKDGNIYVAGTLSGNIRFPLKNKKYAELKANPDTDEGNPFILKLDTDGKVLMAVLLANDQDSYRITDKKELDYDKSTKQVTVKTAIRTGGGEDMPYLYRTYTIDATSGKIVKAEEEEGSW